LTAPGNVYQTLDLLDEEKSSVSLETLIDKRPVNSAAFLNVVESAPDLGKADTMLAPHARENMRLDEIHERQKPMPRIIHMEHGTRLAESNAPTPQGWQRQTQVVRGLPEGVGRRQSRIVWLSGFAH
jgi:hypothetical protein